MNSVDNKDIILDSEPIENKVDIEATPEENIDVSRWIGYRNTPIDIKPKNNNTEIKFTPEEEKIINSIKDNISISNRKDVINYGVDAQVNITNFSKDTLERVKNKDMDDIGVLLGDVVNQLKSFSDVGNQKGIVAFFKRKANKLAEMQTKYESVSKNVDSIMNNLVDHQKTLIKDITNLDDMYEINKKYYRDLSLYIEAGHKKIESVKNVELIELEEQVSKYNRPEDIQSLKDLRDDLSRFEKKIHDLDLTRSISLQMAPQIRMIQNANGVMVEKIQSTIVNTIPLWKSQLVLAIGAKNTAQAADAQKKVSDLTNELLKRNADTLKMATIETAKSAEESIISTDTIKYTNEKLIEALKEVKTIQLDGVKQREIASGELRKLESELKQNLTQISLESATDRLSIENR